MPLSRRQIYRRRRTVFFGGFLVVLGVVIYGVSTGVATLPAAAASLTEPAPLTQPAAAPAWPGFGSGAIGAVGFDGVLAASGGTGPVPIASITKTVTALVILEAKPLAAGEAGPTVRFTDADVDIYYDTIAENGSSAPVVAGMELTEREALEAMLLPSANNYAESLAIWAYGSVDSYLAAASTWIAAHGLTGTTIVDTSGLSPDSVSTPADLVEIGKLVRAAPALAEIVSMKTAVLPTIGTVSNTNKLLGDFGVDGIKTGTTDEAGACLLFSADVTVGNKTVTLVGVMLGGETHPELNQAVSALIESAKAGFHEVELTTAGTSIGSYSTAWGQSAHAVTATDASALVWSDTPITTRAQAQPMRVGSTGAEVGTLDFVVGTRTITVPLVLRGALTDPGAGWRFSHPGELF